MNAIHRLHALRMENDAARYTQEEKASRFERMKGRHENGTAPKAVSAFQLFQTPPELAARMASNISLGARLLEPSAGLGRLLDAVAPLACREIVAVEVDAALCGALYQQNRAGVVIKQRDFLTLTPEETGLFDFVIMNPPFHMRSDIVHIKHALQFLRTGGLLTALCLNTEHRQKAFRDVCSEWEEIPAGTFAKEGTRVETVLLTIRKA